MTLHISKEGKVIPVTFPATVHGGPSGSDFIASMRQEGLLLSCVSFSTERHRTGELILCSINRALRLPVEAQADLLRYAFRSQTEPDFHFQQK